MAGSCASFWQVCVRERVLWGLVWFFHPVLLHATAPSGPVAIARPSGLYAMDPCFKNGTCPALPAFVDGVYVRVNWDQIQPLSPTEYNWSRVDRALLSARAANKRLQIGVWPGIASPRWLYDNLGAPHFPMRWNLHWGPPNCSVVRTPLPWDPVFLTAWGHFVSKLGERYDHESDVVAVQVAGIDAQTMEQLLPTKTAEGCPGASDPAVTWAAKGYTPRRIESAWERIIGFYQKAFTRTSLILMTGPWGFPGVDNQGRVTGVDDKNLTVKLMKQFMDRVGVEVGGLQDNGASAFWAWTPPSGLPAETVFGVQAYGHVTNDTGCMMVSA